MRIRSGSILAVIDALVDGVGILAFGRLISIIESDQLLMSYLFFHDHDICTLSSLAVTSISMRDALR